MLLHIEEKEEEKEVGINQHLEKDTEQALQL